MDLPGTPSDQVPEILATGRSDVGALFISMAEKHPEGADAEYLRWHSLDHRTEQMRLQSIRSTLRVVSTPACRDARAAQSEQLRDTDHVMIYFFRSVDGLDEFNALSDGLRDAGRSPFILNPLERGVYNVSERAAAPRAKAGCDVLPWLPVQGVYLLIEQGEAVANDDLLAVDGVAGTWSATAQSHPFATASEGQRITLCFLDDDPLRVAEKITPVLQRRWQTSAAIPQLAAPFYTVIPWQWDRYLP
ncbi:hypothetical protein GSF27_12420 [Pseudomaricurvus sp. HS19]|nr:hypothetical protein [Pseudomaricurvus sp. HS19]